MKFDETILKAFQAIVIDASLPSMVFGVQGEEGLANQIANALRQLHEASGKSNCDEVDSLFAMLQGLGQNIDEGPSDDGGVVQILAVALGGCCIRRDCARLLQVHQKDQELVVEMLGTYH